MTRIRLTRYLAETLNSDNVSKYTDFISEDPINLYNAGIIYEFGLLPEFKQSYDKAIEFYFKAAELSDSYAINNIGVYYEIYAKHLDKDITKDKAIKYYKLGASLGNIVSLYNLGKILIEDKSGDLVAEQFFKECIEQGLYYGYLGLSDIYSFNKDTDKSMELTIKACNSNIVHAYLDLGDCYFDKSCETKDPEEENKYIQLAEESYMKAYELDSDYYFDICDIYINHLQQFDNNKADKAYNILQQVISKNSKDSKDNKSGAYILLGSLLADINYHGNNIEKGIEYLKISEALGSQYAQYLLGGIYCSSKMPCYNIDTAIQYFKKAKGIRESYSLLGAIYEQKGDYKAALDNYIQAAKLGCKESMETLQSIYRYEFKKFKIKKDTVQANFWKRKLKKDDSRYNCSFKYELRHLKYKNKINWYLDIEEVNNLIIDV